MAEWSSSPLFGDATLDLTDNDLILDYSGGAISPIGTAVGGVYGGLSGLIQRGRNGGEWNNPAGGGILTSHPRRHHGCWSPCNTRCR